MAVIDVLYNDDGTFQEKDGDFVFGNAEGALIKDILLAVPGHYKEFPTLGANVHQYINTRANIQVISRNLTVALSADVFKEPDIDLSDFPETMTIDNVLVELNPDA